MTFAAEWLFEQVSAFFSDEGTPINNHFGWKTPSIKLPGDRIAWVPGDPQGNLGTVGPTKGPGGNPRSLGTLGELVTLEMIGADTVRPDDERAQYVCARGIFDAWFRAVSCVAPGITSIVSSRWVREPKERVRGACLQVVISIEAMIPDSPMEVASASTGAEIELTQLDHTQTISVPEATEADEDEDDEDPEESP